jgi:hypothetical protein
MSEGLTVRSLLNTTAKNDWSSVFSGNKKKLRIEVIHRLDNSDGLDENHIERELGWME